MQYQNAYPASERTDGMTATGLKWIALLTMLIDHTAVALVSSRTQADLYWMMRLTGRLAFPLYCFLITEGFTHTRSVKRYALRLLIFGLISELPFNMLLSGEWLSRRYQNVYWTLLLGLLAIWGAEFIQERLHRLLGESDRARITAFIPALCWCAVLAAAAEVLGTDYGWTGVALICVLYFLRQWKMTSLVVGYIVLLVGAGEAEFTAAISFILMYYYNGRKGENRHPLFFYAFYPAHILVLCALRAFVL